MTRTPAARVCLVTTGQPSTNPRAVKEADALVEAGYGVRLIGAHWADWADATDRRLLSERGWTAEVIDWRRQSAPATFWKSRIRHRAARAGLSVPGLASVCLPAAVSRVTPELTRTAMRVSADLFIAHNLGALPAAFAASRACGARLGFDAEDFHRGEFEAGDRSSRRVAVERTEDWYLPRCDYVTAASPGIADAYARACGGRRPTCVLNVFPLASRPLVRRATSRTDPLSLYWFSQTVGPRRGLEDVVRAMGRLDDGMVVLHVRGNCLAGYRDQLLALASEAGLAPGRVTFHLPAEPDEMVRLAAAFDVGLALEPGLTPNSDISLSNKVFTYLLAGSAVVLTETDGQRRLLPSIAQAAGACRAGDVDTLAAALRRWATDRTALEAARAAAWELGGARYNWDREKQVFLDMVERTLGGTSADQSEHRGSAA